MISKPKTRKILDELLYLHDLECDLYDEILNLDISDKKKDSICDKLNELLNKLCERVEKQ
ncbi:hypothetical protein [Helcococcus kunzii]|uniref:hypothetical protein n=1 Tax=Helcococcus kunzii TaxID=40091 RepID=UPI0024ADB6B5|nr:hypothetical protein [Helcococcus kunzii]